MPSFPFSFQVPNSNLSSSTSFYCLLPTHLLNTFKMNKFVKQRREAASLDYFPIINTMPYYNVLHKHSLIIFLTTSPHHQPLKCYICMYVCMQVSIRITLFELFKK